MTDKNLPATTGPRTMQIESAFTNAASFESAQRMAMALCTSTLVPKQYQGQDKIGNVIIALEMAQRIGASPMAVMQNLHIIHDRPSWSSSFIIAALNSCGKFSPVRFDVSGEGDGKECIAWAYDKATGDRLEGPMSSIVMAKAEGWMGKNGSKWKTMPDLMLRYRAAAFFGRLYAPDVLMGMHSEDEVRDVGEPREVAPALIEASPVAPSGTVKDSTKVEPDPTGSGAVDLVGASDEEAEDEAKTQAEGSARTEEVAAEPQKREYGKPAPGSGRKRRNTEEMEEDSLADQAKANAEQEQGKQDPPEPESQATETANPSPESGDANPEEMEDLF